MTFICERDSYSLEMCENELPMSRLSNRPTDIQTDKLRVVISGHVNVTKMAVAPFAPFDPP